MSPNLEQLSRQIQFDFGYEFESCNVLVSSNIQLTGRFSSLVGQWLAGPAGSLSITTVDRQRGELALGCEP